MTIEINDTNEKGYQKGYYKIKNVNWLTVRNNQLIINYIDEEDGEMHERVGLFPEYLRVMNCE
ncbi:MAG: hypothetical protein J6Y02_06500 [Pseudobutyrivibrio sp.]|nr:hypothetical protein [Pseudobutyrivibrio sp.]